MRSWETDCRSWGFCGQQEFFPPSYRRTRIQRDTMGSKEALLAANITFCVGAAWRDPWCFLEGIFSVKRPMKELTITLAECYRMKKYEFMLFSVLGLKSQNRHWQKEGDIAPLAGYHPPPPFFLNPRREMEEMSFAADISWIPSRANDIMQKFLNKLYPAWRKSGW